jgi:AraC family transcriptional regulator
MSDAAVARPEPEPDPLARARRHVERNLFADLDLTVLAAAAGLSAYHFARQFSARYGFPPMAYVRARRLEVAAERLRNMPRASLIDLALECGFDSQEGFTRAFVKAFGVSPGRYRAGARPLVTEILTMTAEVLPRPNIIQAPSPARKPRLRIAGLAEDFDASTVSGIPALWDRLVPHLPLRGQLGGGTFGVCCGGALPQGLRYLAGVAIAEDAQAPQAFEVVELPARSYLVFRQVMDEGPLHPQMQAGVKTIWGELAPNAGYTLAHAPDLEVYPEDFQDGKAGAWVEWWLPVEA